MQPLSQGPWCEPKQRETTLIFDHLPMSSETNQTPNYSRSSLRLSTAWQLDGIGTLMETKYVALPDVPRQCEQLNPRHTLRIQQNAVRGREPSDTVIREDDLLSSSRRDRPANAARDPALGQAREGQCKAAQTQEPRKKGEQALEGTSRPALPHHGRPAWQRRPRHVDVRGRPTLSQSQRSATFSKPAEEPIAKRGLADDKPCMAATSQANRAHAHRTASALNCSIDLHGSIDQAREQTGPAGHSQERDANRATGTRRKPSPAWQQARHQMQMHPDVNPK